jgi:hypothetical protein
MNYEFLADLIKTQEKHPNFSWEDALSRGQLQSKQWIIDNFPKEFNTETVFVLGGWVGILSWLLLNENLVKKIRSFDLDNQSNEIAKDLNRRFLSNNWKFQSSKIDIMNITGAYINFKVLRNDNTEVELTEKPTLIINTICEHLDGKKWWNNLEKNTAFIIQSNDAFQYPEHVNCNKDLEEFDRMYSCEKTLFLNEMKTENYIRFMKIGYR